MSVLFVLIPLSVVIAGGFLWAFIWAVRNGQYDDTQTPSMRALLDDPPVRRPNRDSGKNSDPTEP